MNTSTKKLKNIIEEWESLLDPNTEDPLSLDEYILLNYEHSYNSQLDFIGYTPKL